MPNNYQIVSQSQSTEINPMGSGFETVWNIKYKITDGPAKGTEPTFTVSEEDHNADYVKAAIEAKIAALTDIAKLGNG